MMSLVYHVMGGYISHMTVHWGEAHQVPVVFMEVPHRPFSGWGGVCFFVCVAKQIFDLCPGMRALMYI